MQGMKMDQDSICELLQNLQWRYNYTPIKSSL